MTDERSTSTRRTVLRSTGAISLSAIGLTGAASAHGDSGKNGDDHNDNGKNGHGNGHGDGNGNGHGNGKNGYGNGKNNQKGTPDPVTETNKFIKYIKRKALRGVEE